MNFDNIIEWLKTPTEQRIRRNSHRSLKHRRRTPKQYKTALKKHQAKEIARFIEKENTDVITMKQLKKYTVALVVLLTIGAGIFHTMKNGVIDYYNGDCRITGEIIDSQYFICSDYDGDLEGHENARYYINRNEFHTMPRMYQRVLIKLDKDNEITSVRISEKPIEDPTK